MLRWVRNAPTRDPMLHLHLLLMVAKPHAEHSLISPPTSIIMGITFPSGHPVEIIVRLPALYLVPVSQSVGSFESRVNFKFKSKWEEVDANSYLQIHFRHSEKFVKLKRET